MQYEHYLNNTFLFWCIVTFIATVLIFSKIDINLGVTYGSLMCLFILYFVVQNHKYNKNAEDEIIKTKNSLIHPDFIAKENYKEISQYIFFIQDFYVFNPQAYEEFIDNVNKFFQSLKLIEYDPNNAGAEYDLLNQYKRGAKNALHSIIYRIPNNIQYTKKFNTALTEFDELFDKYTEHAVYIQKKNIYLNGLNTRTKIIDESDVVSKNSYDDNKLFNYELF